tara:strand:- start:1781 stop:1900 length:120 start_codon:yes stop_codon:yes gene_type:complete
MMEMRAGMLSRQWCAGTPPQDVEFRFAAVRRAQGEGRAN